MKNQFEKNIRKNIPQKLSQTIGKINKKLISKFGKQEFIINSNWKEIVGDFFFDYSEPIRIDNIGNNLNNEDNSSTKGVLHVNVSGPAALDFMHLNDKIIEKINSYFGYKTVSKIVLHQVPYIKKRRKTSKNTKEKNEVNKYDEIILKKTTSVITRKKLEKALLKLGKSILTNKDR